ncbi:hypothetical protein GCM10023237_65720 [Streptomyces coeruleoprunus]
MDAVVQRRVVPGALCGLHAFMGSHRAASRISMALSMALFDGNQAATYGPDAAKVVADPARRVPPRRGDGNAAAFPQLAPVARGVWTADPR